jgi:hypothetical protein
MVDIDWGKITREEAQLIMKIVQRYRKVSTRLFDVMSLDMDISACHISNPLRLKELLEADDFNFVHDVVGISNNINRTTGKLENCFLPRFTKRQKGKRL